MHNAAMAPMASAAAQPPAVNFSTSSTARMQVQITNPDSDRKNRLFQYSTSLRCCHQYRHRPNNEIAKVRNTEIEYNTTSKVTLPPVHSRIANAAIPITRMPF